jgi:hypothetical protein
MKKKQASEHHKSFHHSCASVNDDLNSGQLPILTNDKNIEHVRDIV